MAKIIDPTVAERVIQEYQTRNKEDGGPALIATNGEPLNGFVIDKKSLDEITSDPNNNGIILYLAKDPDNEGSEQNNFILAYRGLVAATPSSGSKSGSAGGSGSGTIYGTPTCPPTCN